MPRGIYDHSKIRGNNNPSKRIDVRKKLSEGKIGNKNPMKKTEMREHMSKLMKDKWKNQDWKERNNKVSKALIGNKNALGKNLGEKNHNWKGGYERTLWRNRQRRIMRLGNGGSHTLGEWETLKAQYNWTCPCCGKSEPEIKLTEDHIIPLIKGGSDNIENIQPLCGRCNYKKHDKIIKYK